MNHLAILRVFSMIQLGLSACMGGAALIAVATGEHRELILFVVGGLSLALLAATVLLLTTRSKRRTSATDGLAVAFLFWVLLPIPAGLPFLAIADSKLALGFVYEAVSSLTTTGHSILVDIDKPLSSSLLFWRGLLHLLGAIASISIAATVLAALNLGGPGIHRSYLFTIREDDFFATIPKTLKVASIIVLASTVVCASLLLISGAAPRDAFSWAISGVSSGLVDPTSSTHNPAMTPVHSVLIFLALLFGTVGFIALDSILSGKWVRALYDPEALTLIFTLLAISILVVIAGVPLIHAIGWSLSSLSTSGISLSESARFFQIPLPLELLPVLIGGSALSAAGGIKLARMIVLSRRVGLEFIQLGYRGSVQKFKFRGRYQSEETVMGVWVYLVGYIIACGLGILIFSVMGLPFETAIRTAIGSLSNSGHIIGDAVSTSPQTTQICTMLGMILGRLEVIAILPALNPSFWRA